MFPIIKNHKSFRGIKLSGDSVKSVSYVIQFTVLIERHSGATNS
jgi:hypothetical protein